MSRTKSPIGALALLAVAAACTGRKTDLPDIRPLQIDISYHWEAHLGPMESHTINVAQTASGDFAEGSRVIPASIVLPLIDDVLRAGEKKADLQGAWPPPDFNRPLSRYDRLLTVAAYGFEDERCELHPKVIPYSTVVDVFIVVRTAGEVVVAYSRSNCPNYAPWNIAREDGFYVEREGTVGIKLLRLLRFLEIEILEPSDDEA